MGARFSVHVVPRSDRSGSDGRHGDLPRVRVRAGPAGGKANAEVEKVLVAALGCAVRVVSGHRSRRKTCEADCAPSDLPAVLDRTFGHV